MTLAVGLVHYTAPPIVGGVEAVLGMHARLLVGARHRVRVITGRGGPLVPPVEILRVPLLDARNPRIRAARAELDAGRVPPAFEELVTTLTDALERAVEGLDVVVAHNLCTMSLDLPATVALRRLVDAGGAPPLVAWTHDLATVTGPLRQDLHQGRPWDVLTTAWPRTRMVAVSEARRGELAAAHAVAPSTIAVVPNGIDRAGFLGLHRATRRLVADLALEGAGPVLLTPARITPRKNLELAIAVVARLRAGGDDARLIVTGAPDPHDPSTRTYLAGLRALAAATAPGAVHFVAADRPAGASQRMTADLYRLADALLIPSRDEGFGLPLMEAAVCRLPVICADLPALREVAGREATYVDPDGDPDEIAACIRERLATDRSHRLSSRVRERFDWSAIYERSIEPLLLEVAAAGRGAIVGAAVPAMA